jgi:anti-anti-sigma regulatory factor
LDKTGQGYVLNGDCTSLDDHGLRLFLAEHGQVDVRIDAAALRRLDVGLLELLLSAARWWRQRGLGFEVTGLGPAPDRRLDLLGLRNALLGHGMQA